MDTRITVPDAARDYQAIGDYGFISDCRSCGLVARDGSIDWLCFRRFDTPPVFARLLDKQKGGYFQIAPKGHSTVSRRYVPDTNVLETRFRSSTGSLVVTDCLPVWDDERFEGRLVQQEPEDLLIRSVFCEEGDVEVSLQFHPRFDYGLTTPMVYLVNDQLAQVFGGQDSLRLLSQLGRLELDGKNGCRSLVRLHKGERRLVALVWEVPRLAQALPLDFVDLRFRVERTIDFWQRWTARCPYQGPYRDVMARSLLVLKGLTNNDSGAVVAAATTSLPEEQGGVRNWDYRFSWLRDSVVLLATLATCGYLDEARAFGRFLIHTTAGHVDELQILYGIGGERMLPEIELKGLEGWRGSAPVRIGNGAYDQFQMDTFGELNTAVKLILDRLQGIPGVVMPLHTLVVNFVGDIADTTARRWREPDDGVWESRGGRQNFTFSKLMAWQAMEKAAALLRDYPQARAARANPNEDIARWEAVRDEIRRAIEEQGIDPATGAFTQSFGSTSLDATSLQTILTGFVKPDDPRAKATIEQIDRNLSVNGHVYRYLDRKDGLPGGEGTFAFCTLWLAKAFAVMGQVERARERLELVLDCTNDLGLLSEEIDPKTGEMLGNFPQAFSHAGLIQAVLAIQQAAATGRAEPRAEELELTPGKVSAT